MVAPHGQRDEIGEERGRGASEAVVADAGSDDGNGGTGDDGSSKDGTDSAEASRELLTQSVQEAPVEPGKEPEPEIMAEKSREFMPVPSEKTVLEEQSGWSVEDALDGELSVGVVETTLDTLDLQLAQAPNAVNAVNSTSPRIADEFKMQSTLEVHTAARLNELVMSAWLEGVVDDICDEVLDELFLVVTPPPQDGAELSSTAEGKRTPTDGGSAAEATDEEAFPFVVSEWVATVVKEACDAAVLDTLAPQQLSAAAATVGPGFVGVEGEGIVESFLGDRDNLTPPASSDSETEVDVVGAAVETDVHGQQKEEEDPLETSEGGMMAPFRIEDVNLDEFDSAGWIRSMVEELGLGVARIMISTDMYMSGEDTRMRWDQKEAASAASIWHATGQAPHVTIRALHGGPMIGRGRVNSIG